MKKLFIQMLSWLLHHANRQGKNEHFYKIKNRVLKKYGKFTYYDVQFIEGKKCFSCGGTGIYNYYSWVTGKIYDFDACHNCHNGWFKRPVWNILDVVQFGKYEFHQPWKQVYTAPGTGVQINGYVTHNKSKYGQFALLVLFICYEKGYLRGWYKSQGNGWMVYWWKPSNFICNTIHILKKGKNAIPFRRLKRRIQKYQPFQYLDELPF